MAIPVGVLSARAQALLSADLHSGVPQPISLEDALRVTSFVKQLKENIRMSGQGTHDSPCRHSLLNPLALDDPTMESDYVAAKSLQTKVLYSFPPGELVQAPISCPTPNIDAQMHAVIPPVNMQHILDRLDYMQQDFTARHQAMNDRLDAVDATMNELKTSVAKVELFTSF
jgi:hypothetical protein